MSKVRDFRIIPRIETYPAVVAFVQTGPGKLALLALFALGERFFLPDVSSVLILTGPIAFITFMPEYRRVVLAAAPVIIFYFREPLPFSAGVAVIGTGMVLYLCVMRWPNSAFGRRPIVFLLCGFSALIAIASAASQTRIDPILWTTVSVTSAYLWFIAYALTDRSSKPGKDWTLELATFRPLWGSTNTPFPKGAAYLRRIEAKDGKQLAIYQLKGLKLLAWAILLAVLQQLWQNFFHGYLGIPTPDQALAMSVQGTPVAWHLRWACQILAYFELIFVFSIFGHKFIAICRIAGFNALRNTYRPLSSTTITEFFNRFYYYFKELLVDFFFYPAFLRYWKGHKRLRMIFATFAAAFFGNSLFHLMRDWQVVQSVGMWKAITSYQVLFFYNALLATGLCVSQMRRRDSKPAGFVRGRLFPALGVGFFYCILNVFDADERAYPLVEHLKYLASLFFIHF
ncbi:MAG TPA: hypothetical protein VG267_08570 [Terracidiphilus sp.]|nr:hypothetical protein [Terracidiphilus sp.]